MICISPKESALLVAIEVLTAGRLGTNHNAEKIRHIRANLNLSLVLIASVVKQFLL